MILQQKEVQVESINVSIGRVLILSLLIEKEANLKWEPQLSDHSVVSRLHPMAPQCLSMVLRGVGEEMPRR